MIRTDAFGEGVLNSRERGVGVSRAAGIDRSCDYDRSQLSGCWCRSSEEEWIVNIVGEADGNLVTPLFMYSTYRYICFDCL